MNMGYQGNIYIGEPSQPMKVIFDLGSPQAWVFSEKCKEPNCPSTMKNKRFAESKSKNFKSNLKKGVMIQYGKGAIAGHPSQDRMCFNSKEESCIEGMSFLTVVKAKDIESLKGSGIVGLAASPATEKEIKDPLAGNVAGFVAQLRLSKKYNDSFKEQFSIYLSNDFKSKGKITFGGYNLEKYAKKGSTEKDIFWADQARNEQYWAINNKGVTFGKTSLAKYSQYTVLDNGMSFAMAPQTSFIQLVKALAEDHGITCRKANPVWRCSGATLEKFLALPSIKFTLVGDESGKTKTVELPKHAYMKIDPNNAGNARLLFIPQAMRGMDMKEGEEYWILGAQFL